MTCPTPPRPRGARGLAVSLCGVAIALSSCSSNGAATDTTAVVTTTSSATTVPVPETEPATTTPVVTEPPTNSRADTEAAIRAAHTRVMTELFARDERIEGPEAILRLAEELTTGPLLERIKENAADKVSSGERSVGPGYDSHIVKVTMVDSENARVLDCSQGRGERYSPDGVLIVPADDFYKLRESIFVLVDGRWLAYDINTGGDLRCEPGD